MNVCWKRAHTYWRTTLIHAGCTEFQQKNVVNLIFQAHAENDTKTASKLSTKFSTHAVTSAFWGLGVVDFHEKITHEKLHNNILGVTRLVLRLIEDYVVRTFNKKTAKTITKTLNIRLSNIDKWVSIQEWLLGGVCVRVCVCVFVRLFVCVFFD